MKKVMLLAAMLAMVLAAAAPAFAQTVAINEGDVTQYNAVCQNILGSMGDITNIQDGAANGVAVADSAAAAEVAQEQGVTIEQVNECLVTSASASTAAEAQYAAGSASAAAATTLPETGGASLFALGAGALLVAGGLVARRIVR
jgi:LPXTG-motif cell wall-anchored protein